MNGECNKIGKPIIPEGDLHFSFISKGSFPNHNNALDSLIELHKLSTMKTSLVNPLS